MDWLLAESDYGMSANKCGYFVVNGFFPVANNIVRHGECAINGGNLLFGRLSGDNIRFMIGVNEGKRKHKKRYEKEKGIVWLKRNYTN